MDEQCYKIKFFEKQEICNTYIKNCRKSGDLIKLQNAIVDVSSYIEAKKE